MGWVIGIVVIVVCVVALGLFIKKMMGLRGEVDAAKAEFLHQVGYEYASALTLNPSPHREKSTPQGKFTHYFEVYSEGNARITAQSWRLDTSTPPRTAFQLVDKKLVGNMRAFVNLIGPIKHTLTIVYPGPYPIGDAELDGRFALYSSDVPSACAVIQQPEVRKALLDLVSVSLIVDESGARFADPGDANVYASGASRVDVNPTPAIRSATRVHLAVERLLERTAGAGA